jgi:hypothetical protein
MKCDLIYYGLYLFSMCGWWVCGYFFGKGRGLREAQKIFRQVVDDALKSNEGELARVKAELKGE